MNTHVAVDQSGTRNTTHSVPVSNPGAKSCHLVIDITDEDTGGGAGSITVTLQGKDPVSGKVYTILASAALVAIATTVLRVGPGLTAAANAVANDVLPKDLVVLVTHNNANPMIYSIGMALTD